MELTERDFEALVAVEELLLDLSVRAEKIANSCGHSRREIAERMGHESPSTVQRLLKGAAYRASMETFARFAWACDHVLEVTLRPRQSAASSVDLALVHALMANRASNNNDYGEWTFTGERSQEPAVAA